MICVSAPEWVILFSNIGLKTEDSRLNLLAKLIKKT